MTLAVTYMLKIAFSDFVAAVVIVFHKYILLQLEKLHVILTYLTIYHVLVINTAVITLTCQCLSCLQALPGLQTFLAMLQLYYSLLWHLLIQMFIVKTVYFYISYISIQKQLWSDFEF